MSVEELIADHEGYRKYPYQCTAGRVTIGFGTNLSDRGLDEEEALYLLERDVAKARAELRHEPYWLDIGEARQAALIDMVYNLGFPRFALFQRMREALFKGDYEAAARQAEASKWFGQVGRRGPRIVGMIRSGRWPGGA